MCLACAARRPSSWSVSSTVRACAGALVAVFEIRGGVLCCEFVEEVEVGVLWEAVMTREGDEVEKALEQLLGSMQHH